MPSLLTWSTCIIAFGMLGMLALRDRAKAKQAECSIAADERMRVLAVQVS